MATSTAFSIPAAMAKFARDNAGKISNFEQELATKKSEADNKAFEKFDLFLLINDEAVKSYGDQAPIALKSVFFERYGKSHGPRMSEANAVIEHRSQYDDVKSWINDGSNREYKTAKYHTVLNYIRAVNPNRDKLAKGVKPLPHSKDAFVEYATNGAQRPEPTADEKRTKAYKAASKAIKDLLDLGFANAEQVVAAFAKVGKPAATAPAPTGNPAATAPTGNPATTAPAPTDPGKAPEPETRRARKARGKARGKASASNGKASQVTASTPVPTWEGLAMFGLLDE